MNLESFLVMLPVMALHVVSEHRMTREGRALLRWRRDGGIAIVGPNTYLTSGPDTSYEEDAIILDALQDEEDMIEQILNELEAPNDAG